MKIIVDTREQAPYSFEKFDCQIEPQSLYTGDYSLPALERQIALERKSLDDLIGCLMGANRERFERELTRASGLDRFAVVVEATYQDIAEGRYRSRMLPHAALQSLMAFQVRYGTAFAFVGNRAGGEYFTYSFFEKYLAEAMKRYQAIVEQEIEADGKKGNLGISTCGCARVRVDRKNGE